MRLQPEHIWKTLQTVVGVGLISALSFYSANAAENAPDFNRDIKPILSENCYHCHGPDANHREADLRLDTEEGALAAIDRSDPTASELLARVTSSDADLKMPPVDSQKHLTPQQVQLLKTWVESGAEWGAHWSFTPIVAPAVPEVKPSEPNVYVRNPIDAFIQEKLAQEGLTPSPEADRRTLIRRVTLDLTGLPPTPAEVDAFLNDKSPKAYENLVERLLNSPAYGERMAWDWLDAARYADSNGYQGDRERTMWPWRDWVVEAFNKNVPYDDFTVWQLAGDLLPEPTFEQRLATGFCRNHMINGEGGRIPEENRVDYVMDMTETMGTVWLGLTLNCCRCHDHKYDPLTNEEYYAFFAFFNQTPVNGGGGDPQTKPVIPAPTQAQQTKLSELDAQIAKLSDALKSRLATLSESRAEWEKSTLAKLKEGSNWETLRAAEAKAEHQQLTLQPDQSVFASGDNPANDTYTVTGSTSLPEVRSIRLEALRHESHTKGGLARSDSGNFVLTEFELYVLHGENSEPQRLTFSSAAATFEQGDLKVTKAFDGNSKTGWAVYNGKPIDTNHVAVFQLPEALKLAEGDQLQFILRHDSPHVSHNLGRFRLSVSQQESKELEDQNQELITALSTAPEQRTKEQKAAVEEAFITSDPESVKLRTEREQVTKSKNDLQNSVAKVMVMEDQPQPRETFMLTRGLYNQPGEQVSAHTPESLPPLASGENSNRLDLARWLVSDEHPLTARVTVNRFWQQVFGRGLVKTTEDFGAQGEVPLHLDLLNWLAHDFRTQGWDVKHLMRLMVTSHAYRQSSRVTEEHLQHDPQNLLLGRGVRYRMPFWMVRDQALASSGLLAATMGGPAVNGYQPDGIWEEATFGNKRYQQDSGEALYRRSLYTFWRRIVAPTMFFDSATRQTCNVKVSRTNTPLQALLTQNDITYVEAARHLTEGLLLDSNLTDSDRIRVMYQRVLSRDPSAQEESLLTAMLERSRLAFQESPEAAAELLAMGASPRNESVDAIQHASWTNVCLAVFNLDETLTRE
ncbi:MAG: PSD1 and planctomycete cytochrome C domain-containing protein [Planctomycetaceae bacterium]